jgi:hypothetical protein
MLTLFTTPCSFALRAPAVRVVVAARWVRWVRVADALRLVEVLRLVVVGMVGSVKVVIGLKSASNRAESDNTSDVCLLLALKWLIGLARGCAAQ